MPLHLLVIGASGFIGRALADQLRMQGNLAGQPIVLTGAGRKRPLNWPESTHWIDLDLQNIQGPADWQAAVAGQDIVINAVGIIRETRTQTFAQLHTRAPIALWEAAAHAGVKRLVQISSLGASLDAQTAYARSKAQADEALWAIGTAHPNLTVSVVRPSLVYAPHGASTRLFLALAALPIHIGFKGTGSVQPVHSQDVIDAVIAVLAHPTPPTLLNIAGPRPIQFLEYLAALRSGLGLASAVPLRLPLIFGRISAHIAHYVPGSLLTKDTWRMMVEGHQTEVAPLSALLGKPPRPAYTFTQPALLAQVKFHLFQTLLRPVAISSMAIIWFGTVMASIYWPRASSLALLAASGLPPSLQTPLFWLAIALDIVLGLSCLLGHWLRPAQRQGRWLIQIAVILTYTVILSLTQPAQWVHPFGPLLKNLPIFVLLGWLWLSEPSEARAA